MNEPLNIQLSNREMYEKGDTGGAWLKLPATAEQLNAALARIGAQGGNFVIGGFETPIPAIARIPLENVQKAGIDELNFLAARLEMFGQEHAAKLNAASEIMPDSNDIHHIIEYTFCPQFFDFHPDIHSHAELGEHLIGHSGLIQIPDEWDAAIDREKLGLLAAEHEKGMFTEYGYVVPSGEDWEHIIEIPQDYHITPKIENSNVEPVSPL